MKTKTHTLSQARQQLEQVQQRIDDGKYKESISLCERLAPVFEKNEAWEDYVRCLNKWSEGLIQNGMYNEGEKKANLALDKARSIYSKVLIAEAYSNLGNCHYYNGACDKSISFYQKALSLRLESIGEKHSDTATTYNDLGNSFSFKGMFDKAIAYHKQALSIRRECLGEAHAHVGNSYLNLGTCFKNKTNYGKAIDYIERAINNWLLSIGKKHVYIAIAYDSLGSCYSNLGKYKIAINHHQKALAIKLEKYEEHHPQLSYSYNNIGICFHAKGDYDKAYIYHHKALNNWLKCLNEKHPNISFSYTNIGNCFLYKGKYEKALTYFLEALLIREDVFGEYHPITAEAYTSLGVCWAKLKDIDKSIEYNQKVLDISLEHFGKQHKSIALAYCNLGANYLEKKDYYKSISLSLKAIEIMQTISMNNHPIVSSSFANIADCYFSKNEFAKSLLFYQKALTNTIYKYTRNNIYSNPNIQEFTKALLIRQELQSKAKAFQFLHQQSTSPKNLSAALFTTQVAAEWIDYIRQSFSNEGSMLTLAQKGDAIFKQGIAIALEAAEWASKKEADWKDATKEIAEINADSWPKEQFDYCWTAEKCLEKTFDFCERSQSMILLSKFKEEEAKGQTLVPEKLLDKEQELKIDLSYLQNKIKGEEYKDADKQDKEQLKKWRNRYFDCKKKYDEVINDMEKDYPDYYELKYNIKTIALKELKKSIPAGTTLLQYFVVDEHIYVFAITTDNYKVYTLDKPETLEEDIKDFVFWGIEMGRKHKFISYAYKLFLALLGPVLEDLQLAAQSNLIIIPDGILCYLPFEALLVKDAEDFPDYKDMDYLIKHFRVSYHLSATLWHNTQQSKKTISITDCFAGFAPVYVSPEDRKQQWLEKDEIIPAKEATFRGTTRDVRIGDKMYRGLPHSEEEVKAIARLFEQEDKPATIFLHEEAGVIKNFMEQAGNYKYVLVAAHADYQVKRPKLTGIVFSPLATDNNKTKEEEENEDLEVLQTYQDFMLYLSDAYHLRLTETELLVLSCCETGIGHLQQGEGVQALHRGFLFAGAQNIIYTLFKVYDEYSPILMEKTFRYILTHQLPYAQALHQAKLDLIKKDEKPAFWSGFVFMGKSLL